MSLEMAKSKNYSADLNMFFSKECEKKNSDNSKNNWNQIELPDGNGKKQKLLANECNKLSPNNNVISNINAEQSMQNKEYKQLEMKQDGMKVILEFPEDSKNEDSIEEVKLILKDLLQEHIEKIT